MCYALCVCVCVHILISMFHGTLSLVKLSLLISIQTGIFLNQGKLKSHCLADRYGSITLTVLNFKKYYANHRICFFIIWSNQLYSRLEYFEVLSLMTSYVFKERTLEYLVHQNVLRKERSCCE